MDKFILRKIVKRYGGSLCIVLDKDDVRLLRISEGDIIDISDIVKMGNIKKRMVKNESSKMY